LFNIALKLARQSLDLVQGDTKGNVFPRTFHDCDEGLQGAARPVCYLWLG